MRKNSTQSTAQGSTAERVTHEYNHGEPESNRGGEVQSHKDPSAMSGELVGFYNHHRSSKAAHGYSAANDDERMAWPMAQRIRDSLQDSCGSSGLPEDAGKLLGEIQKRFRHKLFAMPFKQFIEEFHVNQLLDDYLGLLMIISEGQPEALHQYREEREYYFSNPQGVKNMATQLCYLIQQQAAARSGA